MKLFGRLLIAFVVFALVPPAFAYWPWIQIPTPTPTPSLKIPIILPLQPIDTPTPIQFHPIFPLVTIGANTPTPSSTPTTTPAVATITPTPGVVTPTLTVSPSAAASPSTMPTPTATSVREPTLVAGMTKREAGLAGALIVIVLGALVYAAWPKHNNPPVTKTEEKKEDNS